jgi:hypothetical protein
MRQNRIEFLGVALVAAMLIMCFSSSRAATIVWTNTSGGAWSAATNWSPNTVPSDGDEAIITNNGVYDVSLDIGPTISNLVIGGASGAQTFHTGTSVLSVNGYCVVNPNGIFALEGGGGGGVGGGGGRGGA